MSEQPNYLNLLENAALESLKKLRETFPGIYFYFFEPDYYLFFKKIAEKKIPDIHVENILSNVSISKMRPKNLSARQCLEINDQIFYIGRPYQLLQICRLPVVKSRENPVIFASIPLYSHSMRIEVWKTPVNFKSFTSLCIPFVPFPHYLQIACGTFKTLFINEPLFELKAVKEILSSLSSILGKFDRVYSAGSISTQFARAFSEAPQPSENGSIQNNLILIDRTIDLLNMIRIHDSYISFLEEVGAWDKSKDRVDPKKLSQILNITETEAQRLNMYTKDDPLFEKIALSNLPEAIRQINTTEMQKSIPEQFLQNHIKVIKWLNFSITNGYLIDLVLRIQRNMVDALEYGRCVPLSPTGPSLAFRMLSILHYNGKTEATQSIARLLAAKFGISMFSKWNAADEISMKTSLIEAPSKLKSAIGPFISPMVALLGNILGDTWKRPNLPVKDSFVSTEKPLTDEKRRWLVGVLGEMSATELRMFKKTAAFYRPNDEFVFMSTDIRSPRQFMDDILH
ncbi:hypothetical protein M9Y10_004928 [Tritrichomonas musculus]|uniref:Uncharacterized protein n=1 Tax=Tritrichomonas musculus TaxID=1915356 RepID=A0ABR2JKS1_9EUKA